MDKKLHSESSSLTQKYKYLLSYNIRGNGNAIILVKNEEADSRS